MNRWILTLALCAGCGSKEPSADTGHGIYGTGPPESGSTSVEPDDRPEEASDTGTLCDASEPAQLYLSPDDSNSMSSPVQARASVLAGWDDLENVPLRTWEFLNYYTFELPPAQPGAIDIEAQLAPLDETGTRWELAIALTTEEVLPEARPPVNLTFAVDTSGSMTGLSIEMAEQVIEAVASVLRDGDVVSVVTWSTTQEVLLSGHAVAGPDDPALLAAADALRTDGGTDLATGLAIGYAEAQAAFDPARMNRVILISDGGANVGETDEEVIAMHAGAEDEAGIYLVGVGVGSADDYQDLLMDTVTDVGQGASVFVPNSAEAHAMFAERFVSTLGVAARDVQIRLDLPAGFRVERFSGEEMSEDRDEVRPQHAAPNDAVVFYLNLESCADLDPASEIGVRAWWRDPIGFEEREHHESFTIEALQVEDARLLSEASAIFHYVGALKAVRDASDTATALTLAWTMLERAELLDPADPDLAELREVLTGLDP